MAFSTREASRTLGEPVSLYFIKYGAPDDAYFAYTDAEQEIEHEFDNDLGPVTFLPIPILFGEVSSSGSLDKSAVELRTPQDSALAQKFTLHPPSQVITMLVFDGHDADDDFIVIWAGRILGGGREENEAVYTCEPVSTSLKRPGLRRNYQYQCPHTLYAFPCNADRQAATITRAVTAVAGSLVSLPPGWSATPDSYIGGIAKWETAEGLIEERTIIKLADTNTVILSGIASDLTVGAQIDLAFGCDHKLLIAGDHLEGDCITLHDNVLNYGGQLWIPLKNPIGIINNFY